MMRTSTSMPYLSASARRSPRGGASRSPSHLRRHDGGARHDVGPARLRHLRREAELVVEDHPVAHARRRRAAVLRAPLRGDPVLLVDARAVQDVAGDRAVDVEVGADLARRGRSPGCRRSPAGCGARARARRRASAAFASATTSQGCRSPRSMLVVLTSSRRPLASCAAMRSSMPRSSAVRSSRSRPGSNRTTGYSAGRTAARATSRCRPPGCGTAARCARSTRRRRGRRTARSARRC